MRILFRPLSVLLSGILAVGSCLEAQNLPSADSSEVQELHIRVVEGADSARAATQPIMVAVTDGRGLPVANATVLFRLPSDAPTGLFSDGSRVAVIYTDMQGQAAVKNIKWAASSGTAVIRVTATKGSAHAGLLIEQALSRSKNAAATAPQSEPSANGSPASNALPEPKTSSIARQQALGQPAPGQPAQPSAKRIGQPTPIAAQDVIAPSPTVSEQPTVQITTNRPTQVTGATGKSKKWLWIAIGGAAAAGMAFAFAGKGSGSGSSQTAGSPSFSIGTPSVSIGHP